MEEIGTDDFQKWGNLLVGLSDMKLELESPHPFFQGGAHYWIVMYLTIFYTGATEVKLSPHLLL